MSAKTFLHEHFLLHSEAARTLYHTYVRDLPIIDYHCHLPPDEIARNAHFENLTQIWLKGDHYKWRAMRTLGIPERFITGDASDREKFDKWAETVPYTLRNPLYHWTHMELANPFEVNELLSPESAGRIYEHCGEQLQSRFTPRHLLQHFRVEVVCTTDDPCDSLEHHQQVKKEGFGVKILPTFRPDKAMEIENGPAFRQYVERLGQVEDQEVHHYKDYIDLLKRRHDFFGEMGCRLSDHGLEQIYATPYKESEISHSFLRVLNGRALSREEIRRFKSAMLYTFARWDAEKGWTQQFHLGALRNNNSRAAAALGRDSGHDSIGDFPMAVNISRFFDRLDRENHLAKTILYNLNPADNEVFAAMIGNFQDGSLKGKIQWGSAWWFLDQKDGMTRQLNALSQMGLLSCFVGMLTDSRSFLSYPRHEYFRRILCNLFGDDIERGELPDDLPWIGKIAQDICYFNAKDYFGFE
ncbi:MAG: glucuronate isomerase [Bacteroidetes bacterium]|nr:MAG: glucuronate isomerase [Bacteroidota bacterium]